MKPPPLKDDCFSIPPGVAWTQVDVSLLRLRDSLHAVTEVETLPVEQAGGRILAADAIAQRSNPPYANSAVDGYGFAFDTLPGGALKELPLAQGRSAAGGPFAGTVAAGQALRILTGAKVPAGVDTVVLEEDCSIEPTRIAFRTGLKLGANVRLKGEDILQDAPALPAGHQLRPQDIALLCAVGIGSVSVRRPLRVAVLSTGDEVVAAGTPATDAQIYDANRPMLLETIRKWGFVPVDLGHVRDDPQLVRDALAKGAKAADAILTSGGASAGDEDHISTVLTEHANLQTWRIAIKPGRPLALAMWDGVPVFGLPGNPVAAFVCTLIFARPALMVLSGQNWTDPQGFDLPSTFAKNKKPGRREYLRARVQNGKVEAFQSEGSGRISGLSWATGLVELGDGERTLILGDPVRFYPYSAFGL